MVGWTLVLHVLAAHHRREDTGQCTKVLVSSGLYECAGTVVSPQDGGGWVVGREPPTPEGFAYADDNLPLWKPEDGKACKRRASAEDFLSEKTRRHERSRLSASTSAPKRKFLIFWPAGWNGLDLLPLLIVNPDTGRSAQSMLVGDLLNMANEHQSAVLVLSGIDDSFNVGRDALPVPGGQDDVAYALSVLTYLNDRLCIDPRRVYCFGYSRGGRFCAQLASQLSQVIAAIVPVASVRFPRPNNATRPIPVFTFHGTADPINPFGGGGETYWGTSVMDAVEGWAAFNDCQREETFAFNNEVTVDSFSHCKEDASVMLYTVEGMGHSWPQAKLKFSKSAGPTYGGLNGNDLMMAFLAAHPLPAKLEEDARAILDGEAAPRVQEGSSPGQKKKKKNRKHKKKPSGRAKAPKKASSAKPAHLLHALHLHGVHPGHAGANLRAEPSTRAPALAGVPMVSGSVALTALLPVLAGSAWLLVTVSLALRRWQRRRGGLVPPREIRMF